MQRKAGRGWHFSISCDKIIGDVYKRQGFGDIFPATDASVRQEVMI